MKIRLKIFLLFFSAFILNIYCWAQQKNLPVVLIRVDDIGMNHSVNAAVKQLAESGMPFSTSVMFACPWYQEAVAILQKYPAIAVGVHLTLNAEWKHYRWGPVLGQSAVPSLVDSLGFFRASVDEFKKSNYQLNEVEKELSAQIERALASGVQIHYIDAHMGTAMVTPELRAIVEKLAKKYKLGISGYFGEDYKTMWGVPVPNKKGELMAHMDNLRRDRINLVEIHVAHKTPEMDVLVDLNSSLMSLRDGKPGASLHRQTELNMLLSPQFRNGIGRKFRLITYADAIKEVGLENMKRNTAGE